MSEQALFDPARHEPLTKERWSEPVARAAIARIADDALAAFEGERGWPTHPLDEPHAPGYRYQMLYFGAGGVIWALARLAEVGAIEPLRIDFRAYLPDLFARNRETPEVAKNGTASYLMGDSGLLLLQWKLTRDPQVADRLFETVASNLRHPTQEALWGSPGSLLAAIHMAEQTADPRWAALLEQGLRVLWAQRTFDEPHGAWLWQQQMYGDTTRYLGAAHGYVGNVYPALRGAALLPADLVAEFATGALDTLSPLALRSADGLINWHPRADRVRVIGRVPLMHDCHGAPGTVCRLASAPREPRWDALLRGAAELTWRAGPLAKGGGLCHGTAGNGYALLKLWRRSGDDVWLDRARTFAMHVIAQVDRAHSEHRAGRYSLWTGDVGVALYLWSCIVGDDAFPTLDVF